MKNKLNILVLEDNPLDAELIKGQLESLEEFECIITWVYNKDLYLQTINKNCFDIVLSDYSLPGYNGLEALSDFKSIYPLIPFIFVTGALSEETAVSTIKAGAWDYVVKDRLIRLPLAIRSALQLKEEKTLNARNEAQNRKLLMAIEQSPTHIVIYDINGNIEYINNRFTEVTGYLPDEILGQRDNTLLDENNSFGIPRLVWDNLKNGNGWNGEIQSKKKDGTSFWEYITISPLIDENKKISHFVAVREDITRRKIMEKELIEALNRAEKSDQLKDAFLQNLSHEIRTPMNAIVRFSNLLDNNEEKTPGTIHDFTKIIRTSSAQLLSIVSDILTIARIQTGQESVSINYVNINNLLIGLYNMFKPIADKKFLDFKIELLPQNETINAQTDETKLTQILSNLIQNALKFTHKGFVLINFQVTGTNIEFCVHDTGIGIAREHHHIIFERFRQAETTISTHYGGTGLGLSISRSFAHLLGGEIRVESELNQGSRFYLTIPFIKKVLKSVKPITEKTPYKTKSLKILIADDEETNFLLIEAFLMQNNNTIYHAINGSEALKICHEIPDIDLVLMDIKMPVMDGEKAFMEIRKLRNSLPIIAQTAYALESDRQYFLNLGFTDYIAKPIKQEELLEKINVLFP